MRRLIRHVPRVGVTRKETSTRSRVNIVYNEIQRLLPHLCTESPVTETTFRQKKTTCEKTGSRSQVSPHETPLRTPTKKGREEQRPVHL